MSEMEKVDPQPAPDFELADSSGRMVKLSDFKGRKLSSWCSTGVLPDHTAGGTWRSCARNMMNS
jgi:hypothetical protein